MVSISFFIQLIISYSVFEYNEFKSISGLLFSKSIAYKKLEKYYSIRYIYYSTSLIFRMRYFSKIRVRVGLMTSLALLRFLIERVIVFFGLIDLSIMEFKPNLLHSKIRKRELEREED